MHWDSIEEIQDLASMIGDVQFKKNERAMHQGGKFDVAEERDGYIAPGLALEETLGDGANTIITVTSLGGRRKN